MKPHVMFDLETMALSPAAAILSIGAVKFDPLDEPGVFLARPVYEGQADGSNVEVATETDLFYVNVDLASCMQAGLQVDPGTIQWWMQQSDRAREKLLASTAKPIEAALADFHAWYGTDTLQTWCNGTDFDVTILKTAYRVLGWETTPWKYDDVRDYRTMRKTFEPLFPGVQYEPPEVAHDALHDALAQARHLQKLMRAITKYHTGSGTPVEQ